MNCPKCKEPQWSLMDKKYLEIFDICWSCDKQRWMDKKLSTQEFEIKEKQALAQCG